MYVNGELVQMSNDWDVDGRFAGLWVSFGSLEFIGSIKNIKIFNNVSTIRYLILDNGLPCQDIST